MSFCEFCASGFITIWRFLEDTEKIWPYLIISSSRSMSFETSSSHTKLFLKTYPLQEIAVLFAIAFACAAHPRSLSDALFCIVPDRARPNRIAGAQQGNKKYTNIKRLEASFTDSSIACERFSFPADDMRRKPDRTNTSPVKFPAQSSSQATVEHHCQE